MGKSRRFSARAGALAFAAVVALAVATASPAPAFAASFSSKAPRAGSSTAAPRPTLSVTVFERAGVKGARSFRMTIDGMKVTASIAYTKRGDYRRFKISYMPAVALAAGDHTVKVTVKNRRGHSFTTTWRFSVKATSTESASALLLATLPVGIPANASDAAPSYTGTATIHLFPPAGGQAYYTLDNGPVLQGTTIVVAPPASGAVAHSLKFLLVDAAGTAGLPMAVSFQVAAPADVVPPTTTSNVTGAYAGTATITLRAVDDRAGAVRTFWRLDGGPVHEGSVVIVPGPADPEEGSVTHSLEFWSVDAAGNEEAHDSASFLCEFDFVYTVEPPDHRGTGPCVASDCHAVSVIAIHREAGCQACHDPALRRSAELTFECEACHDQESLWDTHDFLPPNTTSDAKDSYVGTATIHLYPMDVSNQPISQVIGAGVAATYYRLDGGPVKETLPPLWNGVTVVIAPPVAGTVRHTLEFWSVDTHGNPEAPKTVSFGVAPDQAIILPPAPIWDLQPSYVGTAVIHLYLQAGDSVSYRLDGGPRLTGSLVTVSPPTTGTSMHTLTVTFADAFGNASMIRTGTFSVSAPPYTPPADVTPPKTTSLVTEGLTTAVDTYVGPIVVTLRAGDPGATGPVRTFYRLDGGTMAEGTSVRIGAPASGIDHHVLVFWSVDAAGNVEAANTFVFTVGPTPQWLLDHVGPFTTSFAEGVYHGDAEIRLAASDPDGPGVAHTYYQLDGGPVTEGTLISVTAPWAGSEGHGLRFWSVDLDGVAESPNWIGFTVFAVPEQPIVEQHFVTNGCTTGCHSTDVTAIHSAVTVPGTTSCAVCHGPGVTPTTDCEASGCHEDGMDPADTQPPATFSDARASYAGTATIQLSPMDRSPRPLAQVIGAGVAATYYRLDGGPVREVTDVLGHGVTIVVPAPASGSVTHSLEFWSVDVAGNAEAPHKVVTFVVEADHPVFIPTPIHPPVPVLTGSAGS